MTQVVATIVLTLLVSSVSLGASPPHPSSHVKPAALSEKACKVPFQNIGSGCYYFSGSNLNKNWWQSAEYCRIIGGNLLTIDDPVENQDIQDYLLRNYPQGHFFIGGYDLGHEGLWYWQATLKPIGFTDWYPGQPDNARGIENCLVLETQHGFRWNDRPCTMTSNFAFICEA